MSKKTLIKINRKYMDNVLPENLLLPTRKYTKKYKIFLQEKLKNIGIKKILKKSENKIFTQHLMLLNSQKKLLQNDYFGQNSLLLKETNTLKNFKFFEHKINTNPLNNFLFSEKKDILHQKNSYIRLILIQKILKKMNIFQCSLEKNSNIQLQPKLIDSFFFRNKLFFSLDQLFFEATKKQAQFKKFSEYKLQLKERKKLSILYGNLSKKQLEKLIKQAGNLQGSQSENILNILETRLDIVLVRLCFFKSIPLARQWISHQKVFVNNRIVTMPSYLLKPGDFISIKSKQFLFFEKSLLNFLKQYIKKHNYRLLVSSDFFQQLITEKQIQISKNFIKLFIKILLKSSNSSKKSSKFNIQRNILLKTFLQIQSYKIFTKNSFFHLKLKKYITKNHSQKQKMEAMRLSPMKPLNLEVSYKIFTAIYLYSPQKIMLPVPLDLDLVLRSL